MLGFRYTKIVQIPIHGNSERCLVQRQQCAMKVLENLKKKTRFIGIDETWLDSCDYRRRCWKESWVVNSIPVKKINPRITEIVAFDNHGAIYLSLLQANSNDRIMQLFLKELIQ